MPSPAARRRYAASIESFRHGSQGGRPCPLRFLNDRQDVCCVLVCAGFDRGNGALTGLVELRAPKNDTARLSSRKGLSGPRGYQGALFLSESSE